MIDICTVVFRDELSVLKLQAQSIARYCGNLGIRNIYVVVNDDETLVEQIDPNWWGQMAPWVLVVPRTAFSAAWSDNGWLSQQLWKLLVPTMSYNTWCMVLDAKTIFTQEQTLDKLIDSQGCARTGFLDIYPVFEPARDIANQLYNIKLEKQIGPGGVPFLFHNDTVRLMIAETTVLAKQSFPTWFQQQGRLTEFILYSAYVQARYGSFDALYSDVSCLQPVNVCHSEVERFNDKLQQMSTADTVSIHRNAWSALTAEQQQQYRNLLIDREIFAAWDYK